jgi:dTDP-4-amino-4,6-dideoxygalactose transaminase
MIPYGRQSIDDDDIAAVVEVLRGDWLTQGPAIAELEEAIAARVEARHAVAFANGTAALHGATAAAGLGPGDLVATSSLSFAASASCARFVGADVTFVDIEASTLNMDPSLVPDDIDALVVVHYAGTPVDLSALASRPRVIIEDAAQALGASTPDGPVGSCARSDMCMFSLHPVKSITTGEGGIITTNSDDLAERLRRFRSHDIVRLPERGGWYYEIESLAYNYRLTDMQAALGTSQLRKLDRFIARRNELVERYRELLRDLPVVIAPDPPPGSTSARHLDPVRVDDRRAVYDGLRAMGVAAQVHFVPIHHHPLYRGTPHPELPETDRAYESLLSLPLFPGLTDEDQDTVVSALRSLV